MSNILMLVTILVLGAVIAVAMIVGFAAAVAALEDDGGRTW